MRKKTRANGKDTGGASVLSLQQAAAKREAGRVLASGLDLKPVFEDPRSNQDRRKRNSVFFAQADERRSHNRRNACMIDSEWWISRNYAELSES